MASFGIRWARKAGADISVVASFSRLSALTHDYLLIKRTMELSSIMEVSGNKVRIALDAWKPLMLLTARERRTSEAAQTDLERFKAAEVEPEVTKINTRTQPEQYLSDDDEDTTDRGSAARHLQVLCRNSIFRRTMSFLDDRRNFMALSLPFKQFFR